MEIIVRVIWLQVDRSCDGTLIALHVYCGSLYLHWWHLFLDKEIPHHYMYHLK